MAEQNDNLGSFFKETTKLAKEYFETRMEIYRLRAIRLISKSAGTLIWIIISLFLLFLFIIFLGVFVSLWFSKITGSYIMGFGITTLILFVLIIVLTLMRRVFFINPIIKAFINQSEDSEGEEE